MTRQAEAFFAILPKLRPVLQEQPAQPGQTDRITTTATPVAAIAESEPAGEQALPPAATR